MADVGYADLAEFIRAPGHTLSREAASASINPVNAGLFAADGKPLVVSCVGLLPSMSAALASVRSFFGKRWLQDDVALTNDMDAGAVNACEMISVAPAYSGGALVGWTVIRGRVPDFGGWDPGGFSPQAVDRWAEGARLEPVKVMTGGADRREVIDLLRLNSRTPDTTLAHVRSLAKAALALGKMYVANSERLVVTIGATRAAEKNKVLSTFANLPQVFPPMLAEFSVPWTNQRFGSAEIQVERSGDGLLIGVQAPTVATLPINLGRFAAQDIVTASVAYACGLDSFVTDTLSSRIEINMQEPSLLAAPLPAPVGLGRQTAGQVLFRAISSALDVSGERAESNWHKYRDSTCGTDFDQQSGRLASSAVAKVRAHQSQEVSA
jgi:hypothetical protein